jgi:ubiquinone biosynthesis protein UbiJ
MADRSDLSAESLLEAFREDFRQAVRGIPNLAAILAEGEKSPVKPSAKEIATFNARTTWLYRRWMLTLAAEVDRLSDEVDLLHERVNKRPRKRRSPRAPRREN